MGTDPALPQAQQWATAEQQPATSYSFSPIKAIRAIPRLWERKPSTPLRGGAKSKKLWKRFHSSFSNMQTLQSASATGNNPFEIAINSSKDTQIRGVKRLRVDDELKENGDYERKQRGASFLETQWLPDSRKRRKLPDAPINIFEDKSQDSEGDWAMTDSPRALSGANEKKEQTFQAPDGQSKEICPPGISDEPRNGDDSVSSVENIDPTPVPPTANVEKLTQEQEGTLVRSALRSSLDGDDRELLNSFVSRAQAKRAAKAMMSQEVESEKSSSPEEVVNTEGMTPRSRWALEALDTNAPSPIKVPVSPSKCDIDIIPGDESHERETTTEHIEDEVNLGSPNPTTRRSTRVKAPAVKVPAVRNTIALRRAKGNEFIFVQRTEAQQLALATKQHTRQNRGDAISPKYVLEMMASGDYQDATEGSNNERNAKGARSRKASLKKNVTWNDARLVEFADDAQVSEDSVEEAGEVKDDTESSKLRSKAKRVSRSDRSSRSKVHEEMVSAVPEDLPTAAPAPAPALPSATSRSRRVRRLGESSKISGTPVKTGSGRLSKPAAQPGPVDASSGPSTPTKARRKLVPKSPGASSSMLPISKDQSFVSSIPTRSGSTSTAKSEGNKRKSALEASAGCTPMPRRVRARP
ncbi:hypothetical protein N7468_010285 [Penicillium chermesinum]|uniref:Uncharacterized protein n=1 Tax=Penicillium chermesinum TaxID=63820 RepID=A0A9W9TC36_9EURO|nr:uncharacterized protein N7468_010285 [Penicillium chermesinum]KAJ5217277.1 hypothetical protein N7468_010285 [Penicillium chermesinum]